MRANLSAMRTRRTMEAFIVSIPMDTEALAGFAIPAMASVFDRF